MTAVLAGLSCGARSLIAAHSLVVAGTQIPSGVLAVGAPAQVKGPIAGAYRDLAQRHMAGRGLI